MHPIPVQAGSPLSVAHSATVVWIMLAPIPLILMLIGMALGFRALRDIRLAGGTLGGAVVATLAAGMLPALCMVMACGVGLTLLGEALAPASRSRSEIWLVLGSGLGVWLSVLMMRGMHRGATGRTPPETVTPAAPGRSRLATAAIVLTIAGAAIMLLVLVLPAGRLHFVVDSRKGVMLLNLPVILAGLICGVLSHRETAGRTCAWICGALFAVLLFVFAA